MRLCESKLKCFPVQHCRPRALCSFILLTDTYQDATFPVIANKCNFELWFVSAWLVGLGVGLMQVVVQLLVLLAMALQYNRATTPEERDRLLVQGAFTALRGSDNLVLVYAVRPAVEERLGGASSWAMKLSEARIAFLRFIFEDVEQSALQAVFLIFYDEAAFADKLWVTTSIATSLLLSFTIVVQCIPEVRDWLWYRVFAAFPGCRWIPLLRIPWFVLAVLLYRCLSSFPWISACSPSGDPCPDERQWWEFYWGALARSLRASRVPKFRGPRIVGFRVRVHFLGTSVCQGLQRVRLLKGLPPCKDDRDASW
ncbi:unnamed protein product [Symbiodinium sp. KB8]|nr:unnamed protein product [Symbiodinium sp. KB8]